MLSMNIPTKTRITYKFRNCKIVLTSVVIFAREHSYLAHVYVGLKNSIRKCSNFECRK